jgi:formate dehydrogenase maturation protein FdhE
LSVFGDCSEAFEQSSFFKAKVKETILVSLTEFGNKYPLLKPNLPFWEKYYTAKESVLELLPAIIDIDLLKSSDFFKNPENNQPFLAHNQIEISAENGRKLVKAFASAMGLKVRSYNFIEKISLTAELELKENITSFVIAEVHATICNYIASQLSSEPANWLELMCPICGEPAGMGLLNDKAKKELCCSHCHTEWIYSRSKCGLCGHQENEKGTVIVTSDDFKDWIVDLCEECKHSVKSFDMRKGNNRPKRMPLFSLTSWGFDIAMVERGYEPAFFTIYERAGWLK